MQLGKKVNMGVEFSWPLIDVRAGFHQGYYTLGTSFDLWVMRIDAATYGVELGEFPGQLEDRRYMVQVTFEFGIDPGNFSFFKLSNCIYCFFFVPRICEEFNLCPTAVCFRWRHWRYDIETGKIARSPVPGWCRLRKFGRLSNGRLSIG